MQESKAYFKGIPGIPDLVDCIFLWQEANFNRVVSGD